MSKSSSNVGCAISLLAIMAVAGYFIYQKNQAPTNLKRGNELHAAGNQKEAIAIYEANFLFLDDGDKREPLKRIVEFHISQNNMKDAESWAQRGVEQGLSVSYNTPAAQQLVARLSREREAQKQAELDRKAAEAEAEKTRPTKDRKIEALIAAENHAKKFLKFPLDADFAYAEPTSNKSGTFWQVASTVKAKNAFGATLTYSYSVHMKYDGDQWELAYCKINDDVYFASEDLVKAAIAVNNAGTESSPSPTDASHAKQSEYEEKMRAARETANLKQREKSQQNRPAIAANDLRLAQTFLENGDKASYLRLLRKIVAQYPETGAATEAKTLLGQ